MILSLSALAIASANMGLCALATIKAMSWENGCDAFATHSDQPEMIF